MFTKLGYYLFFFSTASPPLLHRFFVISTTWDPLRAFFCDIQTRIKFLPSASVPATAAGGLSPSATGETLPPTDHRPLLPLSGGGRVISSPCVHGRACNLGEPPPGEPRRPSPSSPDCLRSCQERPATSHSPVATVVPRRVGSHSSVPSKAG